MPFGKKIPKATVNNPSTLLENKPITDKINVITTNEEGNDGNPQTIMEKKILD